MHTRICFIVFSAAALLGNVAGAQQALENMEKQLAQPAPPPANPPAVPGAQAAPASHEEPGYLGIIADDQGTQGRGVQLVDVLAGGPAALGGLKVGDLITSIDGVALKSLDDLAAVMRDRVVGEEVTFVVIRDGEAARLDVVLVKRPPPEERRFSNFGRIGANPGNVQDPAGVPVGPGDPNAPASRITPGPTVAPPVGSGSAVRSIDELPPPSAISVVPQTERPSVAPPTAARVIGVPPSADPPATIASVETTESGPTIVHPNSPEATASRTGLLGIRTARVTPELQLSMNLPEPRGALVIEVRPDSPARAAGIPVDAVIVAVDAKRVNDPNDLLDAIRERGAGAEVRLSYYRYGQLYERRVTLVAPPNAGVIIPDGSTVEIAQPLPSAAVRKAEGPTPTPAKMEPPDESKAKADEAQRIRRQIEELEKELQQLKRQLNDAPPK